ncbi:MAG: RecX family transcriptional regulator [Candidatus Zixiibacteriota bacterium]
MPEEKVVTRIETQRRNPKRKSIYLNQKFAFGLDQETLFKHGLRVGDHLTDEEIEKILQSEKKRKAKEAALSLLSYRARSENEISQKLKKKGYDQNSIKEVIADLKRVNLLDDYEFACLWIKDRLRNRPRGVALLRQELKRKGIEKESIEKALDEFYPEESEPKIASELIRKRQKRYQSLDKKLARKRMSDFLLRRGFSYEVVKEAINVFIDLPEES